VVINKYNQEYFNRRYSETSKSAKESRREQSSTASSNQVYRTERLQWDIIRSTQLAWATSCKPWH